MFRRLLLVFTDTELRTKLIKIILLLIGARLLAHIPIPILGIQDISTIIDSDAVFGLLNTISGGSYGRLSFVMLGVGPYITASIVMQLLGVIVPQIADIQKNEGEAGKQKINRWTRWLTVPLAAFQSWAILQFLASGTSSTGATITLPAVLKQTEITLSSFGYWALVILSMTAGSIIMMYIGEIITEYKMGNGISLLILSGIVVRLPDQLSKYWQLIQPNLQELFSRFTWSKAGNWDVWKSFLWENSTWTPARGFFEIFILFTLTLLLVVFVNDAVRKLVVIYSRRGHSEGNSRTLGRITADLPIKVNIAGVIPIIFAVAFIVFPSIISRFFSTANISSLATGASQVENYLSTQNKQDAIKPEGLPARNYLGFYFSKNTDTIKTAINYDPTTGQELFGFTLTTQKELENSFFEGTPLSFKTPATNLGFLPEYTVRTNGILAYTFFYFLLVIFFTYFFTSTVAFKTEDVAENLQKSGAYIPGFKPGLETQNYLDYVSNRINVAGSLFLALIAVVPIVFTQNINFGDGTLSGIVGGTTLLILVSVTIETLKQIEAQATSIDYERFTKY
jgi:preprotein translocase SecY subunit